MKREAREQRLHDLVERYLTHLTHNHQSSAADRSLELIAHSPDSPIALAIAGRFACLRAAQVTLRAIFAAKEPEAGLSTWLAEADWVRWARDPRLLEAHEQVVLGVSRCWSGDAMRRGSTKTDLFESFNDSSLEAATLGRVAFYKLAPLTGLIRPRRVTASLNAVPRAASEIAATPQLEPVLPALDPLAPARTLATRH